MVCGVWYVGDGDGHTPRGSMMSRDKNEKELSGWGSNPRLQDHCQFISYGGIGNSLALCLLSYQRT